MISSRETIGGGVFIVAGVGLLGGTLLVEGSSRSTIFGLAAAALILATGISFGVPRTRRIAAKDPTRALENARVSRTVLVAAASAIGAIATCLGVAFVLRRLSRDAHLGLDLGVVVNLAASAALIYAGVLQWALRDRPPRPKR
jgi:hypothetical protein